MTRRGFVLVGGMAAAAAGTILGLRLWMSEEKGRRPKIDATDFGVDPEERKKISRWRPGGRESAIETLKRSREDPFDLLIIGGGATGTGCALDAATRGLRVALIERGDFGSGTSSKSTKLLHGGVRYLEKAALGFDRDQLKLVREALSERLSVLRVAPHLTDQIAIMLPVYSYWRLPYYWVGAKTYDLLAGRHGLDPSYLLGRRGTLEAFPALRRKNLTGSIVYHDGIQNDARMNVSLALTAAFWGATVANYVEAVDLVRRTADDGARICGARVRDGVTGQEFEVHARGVISATGPFCDAVRRMDAPGTPDVIRPSAGAHLVFPSYYAPRNMGIVDPKTSDGRVLFLLPWEDSSIVGTTGKFWRSRPPPKDHLVVDGKTA